MPRQLLLDEDKVVPDEIKNFPGRQQCDDFLPGLLRSCVKWHWTISRTARTHAGSIDSVRFRCHGSCRLTGA